MKTPSIGDRFGMLVVTGFCTPTRAGCRVVVRCDCGGSKEVQYGNLRAGQTRSCGCIVRTHGCSYSATYSSWIAMKGRCENRNVRSYPSYGGRGIAVCERWTSFENFLADMGERPAGTSIDRIDVNGNYEPSNCRWATRKTQARNRTTTRLSVDQVARIKRHLDAGAMGTDLAREFAVSKQCIYNIRQGRTWRDDEAA